MVCARTVRGRDSQPAVPNFMHRDIEPEWDVVGLNALQGASFSVFYHLFSILLLAIQSCSSPRSWMLSKTPVTTPTSTTHMSSTPIAATCTHPRKMQPVSRIHSQPVSANVILHRALLKVSPMADAYALSTVDSISFQFFQKHRAGDIVFACGFSCVAIVSAWTSGGMYVSAEVLYGLLFSCPNNITFLIRLT